MYDNDAIIDIDVNDKSLNIHLHLHQIQSVIRLVKYQRYMTMYVFVLHARKCYGITQYIMRVLKINGFLCYKILQISGPKLQCNRPKFRTEGSTHWNSFNKTDGLGFK